MQYNATSFHPDLTQKIMQGQLFRDKINAILLDMPTKHEAAALAFEEIGVRLCLHGYIRLWRRVAPLLEAALKCRAEIHEAQLSEALEECGYLLEQYGYGEGWVIFQHEIRPLLCWPDTF